MHDLRHICIFVIVALFFIGGNGDLLLGIIGGNRSTISRVWMDLTGRNPELFVEMAYALTLFFLHLSFAKMESSSPLWVRIPLILLALLPIFRMLWVVTWSRPGDDEAYVTLATRDTGLMIRLALIGVLLAFPAWWFCVPQHVTE